MSQIIISVGREFGSGGRVIAEKLSERFNLPLYDRHLITEIAEKMGMKVAYSQCHSKESSGNGRKATYDILIKVSYI